MKTTGGHVDRYLYRSVERLVFVASPLSTQHNGERAKTGWLGIRIMCTSGATCLPADLFQ